MTDETPEEPFVRIREFEWHEDKRKANLRDHNIDFENVREIVDGPTIVRRSDREGEVRYMVFGFVNDEEAVVVCTFRGDNCRLISARRARRDERKKYHSRLPRRSEAGQD
jgi:uncharacterized DUF497 family protein